jgi:hypothetical protein
VHYQRPWGRSASTLASASTQCGQGKHVSTIFRIRRLSKDHPKMCVLYIHPPSTRCLILSMHRTNICSKLQGSVRSPNIIEGSLRVSRIAGRCNQAQRKQMLHNFPDDPRTCKRCAWKTTAWSITTDSHLPRFRIFECHLKRTLKRLFPLEVSKVTPMPYWSLSFVCQGCTSSATPWLERLVTIL